MQNFFTPNGKPNTFEVANVTVLNHYLQCAHTRKQVNLDNKRHKEISNPILNLLLLPIHFVRGKSSTNCQTPKLHIGESPPEVIRINGKEQHHKKILVAKIANQCSSKFAMVTERSWPPMS